MITCVPSTSQSLVLLLVTVSLGHLVPPARAVWSTSHQTTHLCSRPVCLELSKFDELIFGFIALNYLSR